jgi:hypothetical protein
MAAAMGMPVLRIKALVFLIKAPVLRLTAQAPRLKVSVLYPGTPIHQARPDLNPQKHTTFVSSQWVTVGSTRGRIFRQGAFVIVGRTVALPAKFTVPQTLSGFLIPATLGLSVKSSVTGLAILAMSLAFFVVYVGWIYPNKDVGAALGLPDPYPTGQQLAPGGLGPPQANDADKAETAPPAPPK